MFSYIYHLIALCKVHGRRLLEKNEKNCLCLQDPATMSPGKLYTIKNLAVVENIYCLFSRKFQYSINKKLEFHLPHVHILGTHYRGNTHQEAFKSCRANWYVLCQFDYAEKVVSSFTHPVQSKYYGGNWSISIEGISLEHFSAPTQTETAETPHHTHTHVMLCFVHFWLMIENKMLPQLFHTSNSSLDC